MKHEIAADNLGRLSKDAIQKELYKTQNAIRAKKRLKQVKQTEPKSDLVARRPEPGRMIQPRTILHEPLEETNRKQATKISALERISTMQPQYSISSISGPKAANTIQKVVRGHQARNQFLKEEQRQQATTTIRQRNSARTIQNAYRNH